MLRLLDEDLLEARRKRLRQLVRLLIVRHAQGVEVARAADLELGRLLALLNLDRARVLAARLLQEVPDVPDLLGLRTETERQRDRASKDGSAP